MCNESTDILMETDQMDTVYSFGAHFSSIELNYDSLVMSFKIYIAWHSYQGEKCVLCILFMSQKSHNLSSLSSYRIFCNYLFIL